MVAINTHPSQDAGVAGVMSEYGFVALRSPNENWTKDTMGITGTPSNFLLDSEGRVIFEPHLDNTESRLKLERQVELLLQRRSATGS